MNQVILANLEALIAALQSICGQRIVLDPLMATAPGESHTCPVRLIPWLPHFIRLGVKPLAVSGAPVMTNPNGGALNTWSTLQHLFGNFGRHSAASILVPAYGDGPWDAQLYAWFPYSPSHKQLALARLFHAIDVAAGRHGSDQPIASPSPAVAAALGLPGMQVPRTYYVNNLCELVAAVESMALPGNPALDDWGATPAALLPVLAHFRALGVVADANDGAATMPGPDGRQLTVDQTVIRLFGTFAWNDAFEALFRPVGEGCWDAELRQRIGPRASHRALILMRLYRALELATVMFSRPGAHLAMPPAMVSALA